MIIIKLIIMVTRTNYNDDKIDSSRKDDNTCDNVDNVGKFDSNGDGHGEVNDDDVDDIGIMMLRMIIIMKLTIIMMILVIMVLRLIIMIRSVILVMRLIILMVIFIMIRLMIVITLIM